MKFTKIIVIITVILLLLLFGSIVNAAARDLFNGLVIPMGKQKIQDALFEQINNKDPKAAGQLKSFMPFLMSPTSATIGLAKQGLTDTCKGEKKCTNDFDVLFKTGDCMQNLEGCATNKIMDQLVKNKILTQEEIAMFGQIKQAYGAAQLLMAPDGNGDLGKMYTDKTGGVLAVGNNGESFKLKKAKVNPAESRPGIVAFNCESSPCEVGSSSGAAKGSAPPVIGAVVKEWGKINENDNPNDISQSIHSNDFNVVGGDGNTKIIINKNDGSFSCEGICTKLDVGDAVFSGFDEDVFSKVVVRGKKKIKSDDKIVVEMIELTAGEDSSFNIAKNPIILKKGDKLVYTAGKNGATVSVSEADHKNTGGLQKNDAQEEKKSCFESSIGNACGSFVIEFENGQPTNLRLDKNSFYNHQLNEGSVRFSSDTAMLISLDKSCPENTNCAEIHGSEINVHGDFNLADLNSDGNPNGFEVKFKDGEIYRISLSKNNQDVPNMRVSGPRTFIEFKDGAISSGIKIDGKYLELLRFSKELGIKGSLSEKIEKLQQEFDAMKTEKGGPLTLLEIESLRQKHETIDSWLKSGEVTDDIGKQIEVLALLDDRSLSFVRKTMSDKIDSSELDFRRELDKKIYENLVALSAAKEISNKNIPNTFLPFMYSRFAYEDSGMETNLLWPVLDSLKDMQPNFESMKEDEKLFFLENYVKANRNLATSELRRLSSMKVSSLLFNPTETLVDIKESNAGKSEKLSVLVSDFDSIERNILEIKSKKASGTQLSALNARALDISSGLNILVHRPSIGRALIYAASDSVIDPGMVVGVVFGSLRTFNVLKEVSSIPMMIKAADVADVISDAALLKKAVSGVEAVERAAKLEEGIQGALKIQGYITNEGTEINGLVFKSTRDFDAFSKSHPTIRLRSGNTIDIGDESYRVVIHPESNLFHGSGSGSLPGILDEKSPGLKPAGELLRNKDKPPYNGELSSLSEGDVNDKATSAVSSNFLHNAVHYSLSTSNLEGWNPEKGAKRLKEIEKELDDFNAGKKILLIGFRTEEKKRSYLEKSIEIERLRLERWDSLSQLQKRFIEDPFPVVYGINYKGDTIDVFSGISGELGIPGNIPLSDVVAYIPENKIDLVRKLARESGHDINIESFAALRNQPEQRALNVEKMINILIEQTGGSTATIYDEPGKLVRASRDPLSDIVQKKLDEVEEGSKLPKEVWEEEFDGYAESIVRRELDKFEYERYSAGFNQENPRGVWVTGPKGDEVFITTETRETPLGFHSIDEWFSYRKEKARLIHQIKDKLGIEDMKVGIQGSAVTGISSKTGEFIETPGDLDIVIISDDLFDVIMQRAKSLAEKGQLMKGKTPSQQLSYVASFEDRGEALLHNPNLLPEISKQLLSSQKIKPGIKISQMVVRSTSPAVNKHTIFIGE